MGSLLPVFANDSPVQTSNDSSARTSTEQTVKEIAVNKETVLIGASGPLTGDNSFNGNEYLRGARVFINYVNEQPERKKEIKLIALDDKYNLNLCAENTLELIKETKVMALFSYVGSSTTLYVLPFISSNKIPLVGVLSGVSSLRTPFNSYIFNIRASLYTEISQFIKHCLNDLNIKKIAVLYQFDALGSDGLSSAEDALFKYSKYTLNPAAEASYERGTLALEDALIKIKSSGAKAVVLIGIYKPVAKFIRLCRKSGYNPLFYAVSSVGTAALIKELGNDANGVIISQVVPPLDRDLPAIKEYKTLLNKYFPGSLPTAVGLEGFINAEVLAEGIERTKGEDRVNFVRALESLKDFDIGIDQNIKFSAGDHEGLEKVYFVLIKDGRAVGLEKWDKDRILQ